MPVYLYWGEDDFAIAQAVKSLRTTVLDPAWSQFNYDKMTGDQTDRLLEGFSQAITPPFGFGGRFVWLEESNLCQQCSEDILEALQRTIPLIPENVHLLFTSSKKPDTRLKSTKYLQSHAQVKEFALIPPWKTEELVLKVREIVQEKGLQLTGKALELLAESVGNNTRQLYTELEKLSLYAQSGNAPLDENVIARLVVSNTQNSLQLAGVIRQGKTSEAVGLVGDLLRLNEPALRIVATLIGQFRTWLLVKLMIEKGEKDDKSIATVAELGNPKRVYFIRQEVAHLSSEKLLQALPILLELEVSLKRGVDANTALQTKVIELCQVLDRP